MKVITMLNEIEKSTRERISMDCGWRFAFGHPYDTNKDFNHGTGFFSYVAKAGYGDGPAARDFDDRGWRIINVPHDWAIEQPCDKKASQSHGYKAIGRNFPETSIGWYRKPFFIPETDIGKQICIEFDGIFRNSIVWVNGFYCGIQPSGYSGFSYNITGYIDYGKPNVITVRVDATLEEGWFYEGAGIYRHVWLTKTAPLHIDYHGTFVSTIVKADHADITAESTIVNEGDDQVTFSIIQVVLDAQGKSVASKTMDKMSLAPGKKAEYNCVIYISNPELWSLERPYLYQLVTAIYKDGSLIDHYITLFGIRTIHFDPDKGFFLNHTPVKLKGTNNHQDHAGVGTACADALWEFRIHRLKEMGCNAYRCSHNPPAPEFLDACDRLGMLVIDENRLMGTTPQLLDLLKRMICRDRNHPSIIAWSLGNEEWRIEGDIKGARIVSIMQAFVQQYDPTRRITAASSGGWGKGVSITIDVMGYNYIWHGDTDKHHETFPHQPGIGTEESTTQQTRGIYEDNPEHAHMAPADYEPEGLSIESGWKHYDARPYLGGLFYWTGFDYRGEPTPFTYPAILSQFGILDICGFPKDSFYYLKAWWTDKEVLHITPHWNWGGKERQTLCVRVFSNCEDIELFLNNASLGRKTMEKNSHLEWEVQYQPGILRAVGYKNGNITIENKVETTGKPLSIHLSTWKKEIRADKKDITVITVCVHDSEGRVVPDAQNELTFTLEGPGRIIGIGNGNPSSHEPDTLINEVMLVRIKELYINISNEKKSNLSTAFHSGDIDWKLYDKDKAKQEYTKGREIHIKGEFILPDITEKTNITFYPKSVCEEQSLSINGHLIAEGIKRADRLAEYVLHHSVVKTGTNSIIIGGSLSEKRDEWDERNIDPGIIRVFTSHGSWKRSLFNGLAQVIVQSTDKPGDIILTAASPGLSKGEVVMESR